MPDLSLLAAVVLAMVFSWSAMVKLIDLSGTTEGFRTLGLPLPSQLAIALPILEVMLAVLLIVDPGWGGPLAFATLAGFTVFLAGLVKSGRPLACRCFGSTSTEPVTNRSLVRNGVFMILALVATFG